MNRYAASIAREIARSVAEPGWNITAANAALAALIATLRTDPQAVEAMCGIYSDSMGARAIQMQNLARLCDYLERDDA